VHSSAVVFDTSGGVREKKMGALAHHECRGALMLPMTSLHLPNIGYSSIDIGLQQDGVGTKICNIWKDDIGRRMDRRMDRRLDANEGSRLWRCLAKYDLNNAPADYSPPYIALVTKKTFPQSSGPNSGPAIT
jgi:hypothetical protein